MNEVHDQPEHGTDLTAEERDGLIPAHITTRQELNEFEQQNIVEANLWAFERKRPLTTEAFARTLHKRMYHKVWRWAGSYRTMGKNFGVDPNVIQHRLYEALEQFQYWIDNETLPPDELAVRFHHALVVIRPFPNGNGRWSRLMADLLAVQSGQPRFSWGGSDLRQDDEVRRTYIKALQRADNETDFSTLNAFARS